MKAIIWKEEKLGAEFEYVEIPSDLKEESDKKRKEFELGKFKTRCYFGN